MIVNLEEYGNDIERARAAAASRFAPMFDPQYYRAGKRERLLLLWVVGILERYSIPDSVLSVNQAERLLRSLEILRAA